MAAPPPCPLGWVTSTRMAITPKGVTDRFVIRTECWGRVCDVRLILMLILVVCCAAALAQKTAEARANARRQFIRAPPFLGKNTIVSRGEFVNGHRASARNFA